MPTLDATHSNPSTHPWVRILRFCTVGLSGVGVNMGLFWLSNTYLFRTFTHDSRILLSSSLAVAVSILSNFLLNDAWTWADRRAPGREAFLKRLGKYTLVASGSGTIQIAVTWTLSSPLQLNALLQPFFASALPAPILALLGPTPGDHVANLCGIAAGIAINFFINNLWTFRPEDPKTNPAGTRDNTSPPSLSNTPEPPGLRTQ